MFGKSLICGLYKTNKNVKEKVKDNSKTNRSTRFYLKWYVTRRKVWSWFKKKEKKLLRDKEDILLSFRCLQIICFMKEMAYEQNALRIKFKIYCKVSKNSRLGWGAHMMPSNTRNIFFFKYIHSIYSSSVRSMNMRRMFFLV